jgi:hypothetical protein
VADGSEHEWGPQRVPASATGGQGAETILPGRLIVWEGRAERIR